MKNQYMRDYWTGYRAAKGTAYECWLETTRKTYAYGLQGKNDAYCKGYARYIRNHARRLERNGSTHN